MGDRDRRCAAPRTALVVVSIASWVVWPPPARAYRPFDSTDAAVAAKGELEIEFGPLGFVEEGAGRALVAPSVIFNWGVADGWELVLEGRHFVQLGEEIGGQRFRVEDTALSVKAVLREGSLHQKTGVSVASEPGILLPTINGEPGVGALETIIMSQRWPDLTVHLNGAVAWTRAHRLGLFGGAIFEVHDAWVIRPVAEIFVEAEQDVPTVVSGLVGAIWRTGDGLSLDAGLRLARAGGVDTAEVRAGLTWAFSLGFPK